MGYEQYRAEYERSGFVIVAGFLPGEELVELQRELDRYIRDVVPGLPATHAFYDDPQRPETLKQLQHMQEDPYFAAYRDHSRWKGLAESLIGESASCQRPNGSTSRRTDHPTPPHQDNYYFNLAPPNVLTIWVALEDIDEENGCLRYVPGSHQRGFRPHARSQVLGFSQGISDYSPEDRAREVVIRLKAGDAVVHHGMTIHRADPNRSATRSRARFAMVFRGVSCRRDETAYQRYQSALQSQHQELGLKT